MSSSSPDAAPTASLNALQRRAQLLAAIRRFFDERGYFEVETPLLSHDVCVDAWLDPFIVRDGRGGEDAMYLQTSPEFAMKRLLVAGATAIYQITRSFRRGEIGRIHNPEFTIVEWYRVGATIAEQMVLVEQLVRASAALRAPEQSLPFSSQPFERLSYDAAFERFAGRRVLGATCDELASLAQRHAVSVPPRFSHNDRDAWLNLLLASVVEPRLKELSAVFVYDYPDSQSALARVRRCGFNPVKSASGEGDAPAAPLRDEDAHSHSARQAPRPPRLVSQANDEPPVAERFELYLDGIEICNGYQELTDAEELASRMQHQADLRRANGLSDLPTDSRLISAMRHGLPECAGVALGFDRLAMWVLGEASLADVIAFPFDRA